MWRKNFEIAIFLLLIFTSLCAAEEEKKATAQQEVKDFSFVQYQEGGGQKWKMNGRSAEVLDNKVNIEYLSALSFGEGTMLKLKAKEGIFDKGENIVNLNNNVVMASTDGTKLTTDHLVWNAETKNVSTDVSVNIIRPDMNITGTGAVCDVEGKTAELKQDISASLVSGESGILNPESNKSQTTITCDGPLELNYRQNRAFFYSNVKIEDSKGSILADRVDVYFSPATRRVKCVVARGNVRIINGENVTYSEKAIYLVDQGRVILPNRPKLIINSDSTR
ncbi:MAG: LPS export ABC transporter periplasmic protein LptC [Candidatus Omnitrophica bacterium]|nr:LPS export ABC transporter periplasmic protein LptC [Candidatus Omnitrophota bacterium]